jgi:hypothetical protein
MYIYRLCDLSVFAPLIPTRKFEKHYTGVKKLYNSTWGIVRAISVRIVSHLPSNMEQIIFLPALTFLTETALTVLAILTEITLTVLTFLTELVLTVLTVLTELVRTALTFVTELALTVNGRFKLSPLHF